MNYYETFGINVGKGKYHEEVIYSILLAFNLLNNEMTAYLKEYKLTPAQFNVLMVIKHQSGKEGISQVEISKKLIVTPSNMTRLLDKLDREKFIERLSLPGDRRVKLIKISAKASKLLDQVWPGYNSRLENLASGITKDEQKTAADILVKLVGSLAG